MRLKSVKLPLSRLVAGKRNPRRVKPDKAAHSRLVASIRSHGFFSSLVVNAFSGDTEKVEVVAGKQRLAALREVYRDGNDPAIPCIVSGDGGEDSVALAESFIREPMHPLDEAEAFSRLANAEGKNPEAIAAEFGIAERYVVQRMKLAALASVVKASYRAGNIDTATAEAFAAVPESHEKGGVSGEGSSSVLAPQSPTSGDLAERQVAAAFTHQTLAVRIAVFENDKVRKVVLAMLLHEKVRSLGLSVGHDANGVTLHATMTEGFVSLAWERLSTQQKKLDPLDNVAYIEDSAAFDKLMKLTPSKLDVLINSLVVGCLTCHASRQTKLITRLAQELKVNVRDYWTPDACWLSAYRKIQLAHLLGELRGPSYGPAHETRKKTELVEAVALLFSQAADGTLEDKQLADRVNQWIPANLHVSEEKGEN